MAWLCHFDRRNPICAKPNEQFASAVWKLDLPHTALLLIQESRDSQPQGLSLGTLLWRTKRFKATKARDKVYAILSLVDDQRVKDQIPIDYQSDDIYIVGMQVSRYLFESGHGAHVLYNCLGISSKVHSWELLLNNPTLDAFAELYQPAGTIDHDVYKACANTQFIHKWISHAGDGGPALSVRGCIVDQIASIGPALPYTSTITHDDLAAQSAWFPRTWDWMAAVQDLQPLPLEDFTRQGWQAAVADLIIPSEGEGRGYVRTREVQVAPLCLEAIDNAARWGSYFLRGAGNDFKSTLPLDANFRMYAGMLEESFRYAFGRRLALTSRERLTCCVPRESEDGDCISIILGCPTPFVLRPVEGQNHYRIVGSCYVHGLMDGQAVSAGFWKEEDIEIR